jgi:uncharacterized Tic20 family protein
MLWIAITLLTLMAAFHTIIGERFVLQPIKKTAQLPKMWGSEQATFRTLQATWHLVSALWLGIAGVLIAIELEPENATRLTLFIFAGIFAALAIVPLIWNAGKHQTWIAFGLIAASLLAGAAML